MIEAHKPALFTLAEEGGVKMLWTTSIITGTIGAFCWPNIFLRLFMASSPREAKKSLFVAPICALVVVFFILAPTMGGTLLEGFPEDAQIGLFWMANKYGGPVMLAFVALFAASASLTTISTDSNALAIPLAKYVLQPLFKKTPIVRLSMITTAVICAVAMWIATMDVPQLNFFAIMLYNFIGQISIPIILGAYWKKTNKTGVILGLIVGCGFAFVNQFWASAFDWTGGWGGVTVGLILNLVIVVIVGFARGKQPHVDEMFEQFKLYDNAGRYWGKKDDAAAE
jgi:SSS family solute:Na+ symporter